MHFILSEKGTLLCVSLGFRQPLLNFPQKMHFRISEKGTPTCVASGFREPLPSFPQRVHFRFSEKVHIHVCFQGSTLLLNIDKEFFYKLRLFPIVQRFKVYYRSVSIHSHLGPLNHFIVLLAIYFLGFHIVLVRHQHKSAVKN